MRACVLLASLLLCAFTASLPAQHKVDPRNLHERIIAIVPMIGKGTLDDPRRPMFTPLPGQMDSVGRTGIIGFSHVPSDDGQFALVEFVARDRTSLDHILSNKAIQSFVKGIHKREDIEAEFQKLKKGFKLD
jgi:hypothetical protein